MKQKILSDRQLQIMETLWKAEKGMTASGILKQNEGIGSNTVNACLRSLEKKGFIKVGDIVYSGTVLARSYVPLVQREEYFQFVLREVSDSALLKKAMNDILEEIKDEETLSALEELIRQRRRELKKNV